MYFDLMRQQLVGEGSEKITEVRWSSGQCVVNNEKFAKVQEVTLRGADQLHIRQKIEKLVSESKAGLFALLKVTPPFFINNGYQSKVFYAEVEV